MSFASKFQALLSAGNSTPTAIAQELHANVVRFVVSKLNEKKMTKRDLAAKIGVKESQISRILNADGNLTTVTIGKLYWAFDERPEILSRKKDYLFDRPSVIRTKLKGVYLNDHLKISNESDVYGT